MTLEELLSKEKLTNEEKNKLIELICDMEKNFIGISFGIINMPKRKYKLSHKKNNEPLGMAITNIVSGEHSYSIAIDEDNNSLTQLLTTIYHEIEHIRQKDKMLSILYPLAINTIITKEFLVISNQSYYKDNYERLISEINSRISGRAKTNWLLNKKDGIKDLKIKNYIDENLKKVYILDNDLGEISLSVKIDKAVKRNLNLISRYPSLGFEYNIDGTRKSISELFIEEPKFLKGKNDVVKRLIEEAFNELYFLNIILTKVDFSSLNKNELERVLKSLNYKLKNLKERKKSNLNLYRCEHYSGTIFKNNNDIFDEYIKIIKKYTDEINLLYTSGQEIIKQTK